MADRETPSSELGHSPDDSRRILDLILQRTTKGQPTTQRIFFRGRSAKKESEKFIKNLPSTHKLLVVRPVPNSPDIVVEIQRPALSHIPRPNEELST